MPKADKTKKLPQWIHEAVVDAKGQDVTVLDVGKVSDFTDYMVIVTGTSTRHVVSVADKVLGALREHDVRPVGVEGMEAGDWVLIDFGSAVVHVMRQQTRDFYGLEKLWAEGKPVEAAKKTMTAKTPRKPRKAKAVSEKRSKKE